MIVLAGSAVTLTGDAMAGLAISWWVLSNTGSAALMSLVAVVSLASGLLAGPWAGTVADRHGPRLILTVTESGRAVIYAAMAWAASFDMLSLPWTLAGIAAARALGSAYRPAMFGIIPKLVSTDYLERANAWVETVTSGSSLWGPALGGAVYAAWGLPAVLYLNAVSFALSALSLAVVRVPKPAVAEPATSVPADAPAAEGPSDWEPVLPPQPGPGSRLGYWHDLRAGLAFVWRDALLVYDMVFSSLTNFFVNTTMILLPVVILRRFQLGPEAYGLLRTALPAGLLIGAQLAGRVLPWVARGQRFFGLNLLVAPLLMVLAVSNHWAPDVLALALAGMVLGMSNVLMVSALQRRIPPEFQSRSMAAMSTVDMALTPVGQVVAGVLADTVGAAPTLLTAAGGTALGLFLTRYLPGYAQMLEALQIAAERKLRARDRHESVSASP